MIPIALLGICILSALAVFQLLLIAGKPLGNFAWGGQHTVLPQKLRVASAFSVALYIVFSVFLVSKAGLVSIVPDGTLLTVVMWVLTGYFTLGILMNAISRSTKERLVMTPVAGALTVIFLVVTVAGTS